MPGRPLRERPEVARQPDRVEQRLRLVRRPWPPTRIEASPPPEARELVQLRRAEGGARVPAVRGEPALEVPLRPEEDRRASGEADVVPPPPRRNEEVHEQIRALDELAVLDAQRQRLPAARALRRDLAVAMQRAGDAERVPGTRAVPGPRGDPVRSRREAERVRHP